MLDLQKGVRSNPKNNRLIIGDFLFAEYTCGIGAEKLGAWTDTDYLVHVVTGKKTWHLPDGTWLASPGETLFFKKGALVVEQHFEVDFCLLMFFIPDGLMRSAVRELAGSLRGSVSAPDTRSAWRVKHDTGLSGFFQSMRAYFSGQEKPSEPLLRLKLKELITGILTSGKNPALAAYVRSIGESDAPSIRETMETNFRYNLSLAEYARLCHRSLSSFKRDFQAHFNEAPGKWLLRKRLDHSAGLLRGSRLSITAIAYESGFEDVSHFSRVFKQKFGVPPIAYRKSA